MIAHLKGKLLHKTTHSVIVDNNGVGYEVTVPLSTFYALPEENGEVSLHIHTHVREDALALFGFRTLLEKEIFLMLVSVSGIGPKLGVNVLSGIGPDELLTAMAQGDIVKLQSIPGVGKKTSERIALELKDKALKLLGNRPQAATQVPAVADKRVLDDAVSALANLGYQTRSANEAVKKAYQTVQKPDLEALIREALRVLA
ncbi:MAG: Holliday junction branch migration protein RuvA [Desulfobacteraceae bacterium]|nr:MAG: Holliday junction branch migration protein RuvA [Desulfobacteraceae bacterium]